MDIFFEDGNFAELLRDSFQNYDYEGKSPESEARETLSEMYDISGDDADKVIDEMYTFEWIVEDYDINYKGLGVHVIDGDNNYYLNFHTGIGEGIYPKEDWTLEAALEDQFNI